MSIYFLCSALRFWLSERALICSNPPASVMNWSSLFILLLGKSLDVREYYMIASKLFLLSTILSTFSSFSSVAVIGDIITNIYTIDGIILFLIGSTFYLLPYVIGALSAFLYSNGWWWSIYLSLSGALVAVHIYDFSVRQSVPFSTKTSFLFASESDAENFRRIAKLSIVMCSIFFSTALFHMASEFKICSPLEAAGLVCIVSGFVSRYAAEMERHRMSIAPSNGSLYVDDIV